MRRIRTRRRAAIALEHRAARIADLGSVASARPPRPWDRTGRATATDERQRGETR